MERRTMGEIIAEAQASTVRPKPKVGRKAWLCLALGITVGTGAAALAASDAEAALRPCHGRSVYVVTGHRLRCDVSPPQRLHLLRSTQAECDHAGGRFAPRQRICWDVDY